jgi:hypothetical protein
MILRLELIYLGLVVVGPTIDDAYSLKTSLLNVLGLMSASSKV